MCVHIHVRCVLSRVRLFVAPRTVAHQVPWSMEFFQARILEWNCHFLLQGIFLTHMYMCMYLTPLGSVVKNLPANQETWVQFPTGKVPGRQNGNPLQYSCLGNPMDRGAWWATVHEEAKQSDTT